MRKLWIGAPLAALCLTAVLASRGDERLRHRRVPRTPGVCSAAVPDQPVPTEAKPKAQPGRGTAEEPKTAAVAWIALPAADPDPAVRAETLRRMPVGIGAEDAARVGLCLRDPDPTVVRAAIAVLRSANELDPRTLAALRDTAFGAKEEETRRAARRALFKFAEALPQGDQIALLRATLSPTDRTE